MEIVARTPPLPAINDDFEVKPGFRLTESLDEFRAAIKKSQQKVRIKPGIYRAKKADPSYSGSGHESAVSVLR